jgi:hypothetical protein
MMDRSRLGMIAVAAWMAAFAAPAAAAPPPNDLIEGATPVGDAPVEVSGTNRGASRQPGEPLDGLQTVWFAYRPTVTGRVAVEVSPVGMPGERMVGVFTGPALGSLTPLRIGGGMEARVAFDALPGETYWIAVARTWATGLFNLRIRPMPLPANDAFHDATTVGVPSVNVGNLADATSELGENDDAHSVWFRFRPRRTGSYWLQATGTCAGVAVYRGGSVDEAELVQSRSDGYRLRRGRVYHASVTCYGSGFGDYELRLSDGSIEGDGVTVEADAAQTVDSVRARGLRLTASAARPVAVDMRLRVSRRTARRLDLSSRTIGRLRGHLQGGLPRAAAIRLSREARRALQDETDLAATLRVEVTGSTSPDRFLDLPVSL